MASVKPVKYYLAGRYDRREELNGYAAQLVERGFRITSRWLKGEHEAVTIGPDGKLLVVDDDLRASAARFALEDLEDLASAEIALHFTETPEVGYNRGGRHVEFGFALALGVPNIIIGPPESVFHYLKRPFKIIQYDKFEDFLVEIDTLLRMFGGSSKQQ